GLAGADDARAVRSDDGHQIAGDGGDAAETAEDVEGGTLGGEEDARRASHGADDGSRLGVFSIVPVRHGLHGRVEEAEGGEGDLQTGDAAGVADDDVRFALEVRRQAGVAGQIAGTAEILYESAADDRLVEQGIERRGQRLFLGAHLRRAHRARAPAASKKPGCTASSNRAEPSGAAVR